MSSNLTSLLQTALSPRSSQKSVVAIALVPQTLFAFQNVTVNDLVQLINSSAALEIETKNKLHQEISLATTSIRVQSLFNKILELESLFLLDSIHDYDSQIALGAADLDTVRVNFATRYNFLQQMRSATEITNSPLAFNL